MSDKTIDINLDAKVDAGLKAGVSLREAIGEIPNGVIGALLGNKHFGLEDPVFESGEYKLLRLNSPESMTIFWHSAAHLLAQAVGKLYPHAKLGIGPAIKNGFYYDFDFGTPISADELEAIEAEMKLNVEADLPIIRKELNPVEASEFFNSEGQTYKIELIEGLEEQISTYSQGEFTDLCRGPHVPSTGYLKHFKLTAITGAYWRGDERNPMLQRIYGTAYPTSKELKKHMRRIEEAKKRDHRLLGKQLKLFSFQPEAPGAPFWHPRGRVIWNETLSYIRNLLARRGYGEVGTPLIMTQDLWERSGHWGHYHNNMYFTSLENRDYAIKPMNCPGAVLMYKSDQWSYRDLPLRWAEIGIVHRYEKSGTLHGLFRVRHITQDDAHVFCTEDQLVDEVGKLISLVKEVLNHFGLTDIEVELSTRPKDRIGSDEVWDKAEKALRDSLAESQEEYTVSEGEGAFYGPKIDFHIMDSLGRGWQLSTIQLDFNFPERFDLEYIGPDNQPHRPVMLHRAIFGAVERFIGILIEHYAGDFPLWLTPEQAIVLPISEQQVEAANSIKDKLIEAGIRCSVDGRSEKIGRKIRDSEKGKIPYMLIVGQREAEDGTVSLRRRGEGDLGVLSIDKLKNRMEQEIAAGS